MEINIKPVSKSEKIANYFRVPVPTELVIAFAVFVFGWGLAIFWLYIRAAFRESDFPYNTFLPAPVTRFGDFYLMFDEWSRLGLGGIGYGLSYLPATYIFVQLLRIITENPYEAIVFSQTPFLASLPLIIFMIFRKKGFAFTSIVLLVIVFSYPNVISWHTGNIESWVALLLVLATTSLIYGKRNLFIILISIAGAMKIYPLIFLVLILLKSKHKLIQEISLSLFVVISVNLIAITFLRNGITDLGFSNVGNIINGLLESQNMYQELMWFSGSGNAFGHSLLNSIHLVFGDNVLPSIDYYFLPGLLLIINLLIIYTLRNRLNIENWKVLITLGALACLYVPTSTDYKLFYLLPGLLTLLYDTSLNGYKYFIPLILIISTYFPKPYLYVGTSPFANATAYSTTVALLLLSLIIFYEPRNKKLVDKIDQI